MKCQYCGAEILDGDSECMACANSLPDSPKNEKTASQDKFKYVSVSELRRDQARFWLINSGLLFASAILCFLAALITLPNPGQLFMIFAIFLAVAGVPFGIIGILNLLGIMLI